MGQLNPLVSSTRSTAPEAEAEALSGIAPDGDAGFEDEVIVNRSVLPLLNLGSHEVFNARQGLWQTSRVRTPGLGHIRASAALSAHLSGHVVH